jgi:UDP-N-acetyl-D-mannosaminuronic acid transferase (WecB/TagA/CpsF family)
LHIGGDAFALVFHAQRNFSGSAIDSYKRGGAFRMAMDIGQSFLDDAEECSRVAKRIDGAKPDLLFVGLGAPKQEYWIERYAYLPAKVMMGIGGSFEFVAGFRKRAPVMIQKIGFEWLWRLCMEPRRLWKRYLVGNTIFLFVVFKQWWSSTAGGNFYNAEASAMSQQEE